VLVKGRVMRATGVTASGERDGALRNLANTYRRMRASPVPHAEIDVVVGGTSSRIVADNEGFFRSWIDLGSPSSIDAEWIEASLTLVKDRTVTARAPIRRVTPSATYGIISDLDDTVIQSRVSNLLLAIRTIVLGNARTRLPFPGVAALYRALEKGGDGKGANPVYYVSSSPWNIYDLIVEFLELQKIPVGPVCLRDWDVEIDALSSSRLKNYKEPVIREILEATAPLPFILIGDTTQKDPEIYRTMVSEFPGRILAVYIRNVDPDPRRKESLQRLAEEVLAAGSSVVLADDSAAAARHAAEHGWIPASALPEIDSEKKADEPGSEGPAPTVVVE
jgi:phosphatidate phosphatase APP1